jgi:hypothetical protein
VTARSGPRIGYLVQLAGRAADPASLRPPRALFADAGHPLDGGQDTRPGLPAGRGPGPQPAIPVEADGLPDVPIAPAEVRFPPASPRAAEPRNTAPGGISGGDPVPVALAPGTASTSGMAVAPFPPAARPGLEPGGTRAFPGLPMVTAGTGTPLARPGTPLAGSGAADRRPGALPSGSGLRAVGSGPLPTPTPPSSAAPLSPAAPAPSSAAPPPAAPSAVTLTPTLTPPAPGRPVPGGPGPTAASPVPDGLRGTPVIPPSAPAGPRLAAARNGSPLAGRDEGGDGRSGVVPDLVPPPARATGRDEQTRMDESRREAPGRVTIGAIEVTVVPPARPAGGRGEPRPAPAPAVQPRSAPSPAEAGGARLRDGLRRWYGIAQG